MKSVKRFFSMLMVVCMANVMVLQTASASLIPTDQVARSVASANGESPHDRLSELMSRSDVVAQLEKLGVNPEDAQVRVASLTDEEAVLLADQIESAPAGAGILGAILLVFFVLLITDVLGFTKVFPFTRSAR
jgi:hypothetical protein